MCVCVCAYSDSCDLKCMAFSFQSSDGSDLKCWLQDAFMVSVHCVTGRMLDRLNVRNRRHHHLISCTELTVLVKGTEGNCSLMLK